MVSHANMLFRVLGSNRIGALGVQLALSALLLSVAFFLCNGSAARLWRDEYRAGAQPGFPASPDGSSPALGCTRPNLVSSEM